MDGIGMFDCLIGHSALKLGLPIYSFNEKHYKKIPANKDIFSKLPKAYKLKSTPKKREEVIKKITEHVNKLRSGYIIDKV